jgi:death-on-curing protein
LISLDDVIGIHSILIENFGGHPGVRDRELLKSSIFRPYVTFDSVDLYPTTVDKAAAVIESIVKNHPFFDGNKRTGYTIMRLLLLNDELDIKASEDEKFKFVIQIAEGKLSFDEIRNWINIKVIK